MTPQRLVKTEVVLYNMSLYNYFPDCQCDLPVLVEALILGLLVVRVGVGVEVTV